MLVRRPLEEEEEAVRENEFACFVSAAAIP
jgi:hypothetical protein